MIDTSRRRPLASRQTRWANHAARRLAVAGVIASVIGAFYYLRIVYYMYFGAEAQGVTSRMGAVQYLALMVPAAAMVLGAVSMFGVDAAAGRAAETLVAPVLGDQQPVALPPSVEPVPVE